MKKIKQMKKIVILKSTASFNSFLNEQSKALLVALPVFFSKLIEYFFYTRMSVSREARRLMVDRIVSS